MDEHKIEQPIITKKKKVSAYKIATLVLAVLLVASIVYMVTGTSFTGMSAKTAEEQVSTYISGLPGVTGATFADFKKDSASGMITGKMTLQGQSYTLYVSPKGDLLFPTAIPLTSTAGDTTTTQTPTQQPTEVQKSDKPVVELFVMSYCPYGTQMEKAILPAVELLGNKIDFKLRFVDYAMHGEKEITENLLQYCIQKEQPNKFNDYLTCFLEASDSATCLTTAGIDTTKLDACTKATDTEFDITANFNDETTWSSGSYPPFNIDKDLNTEYSVQGSPTLIINGAEANPSSRSPDAVKTLICSAFTTAPTECDTVLSTAAASAGFGSSAGTAAASGSCA